MSAYAVTILLRNAKQLDDDQGTFIVALRTVMRENSWRDFTLESGFRHTFDAFPEFLDWVGVKRDEVVAVLRVRGEHDLAAQVLAEGVGPVAGHGEIGNGRSRVGVANSTRENDATYVIARLNRDDPALAEEVISGKLTPNAAAIKAGIRHKYVRVRTDSPKSAVTTLLKHFTREQLRDALGDG